MQRIPYCQQFTPEQTPLRRLQPILRQTSGDQAKLKKAIASAFFKDKSDPKKLAGNTLISLKAFGILDTENALTSFGTTLANAKVDDAPEIIARRILLDLDGLALIETLREMQSAGIAIHLRSVPEELQKRGVEASKNSSDLSGVLNWLRAAGVLTDYTINDDTLGRVLGTSAQTVTALKGLTPQQIAFLRAMVALNVADWYPYNKICEHAEHLYTGEIKFNWKVIPQEVVAPLAAAGFLEMRKREKQGGAKGRGGKPFDVKPKGKFFNEIAAPALEAIYRFAGQADFRKLYSQSLADIVTTIKSDADINKRGKALEHLAIRLCQLLDLDFMGWRTKDVETAGGAEVDAFMHSTRLVYSRWQVQCKIGQIHVDAVAKEVGLVGITLSNVILVVGTEKATKHALDFRRRTIETSALNIIFIDGPILEEILKDPGPGILSALRKQAQDALKLKPKPGGMQDDPPSSDGTPNAGTGNGDLTKAGSSGKKHAPKLAYSTPLGEAYCGDSLDVIPYLVDKGVRAKLIVTSPPFALVRKKDYGNEDAETYCAWMEQFIPQFKKILTPDGSLIMDIGGAWIKGIPAKSVYQFKVLLRFCENGFYLAQDFYHYNPARLPTPAEWVTVRRLRVKDAINNVWWLALDPFVKADNRQVLRPYSESMKGLLRNGYKPALRPSGHEISDKFQKDNNGAIPPNLIELANTESNSHYLRRCGEEGIKPHPARYPAGLPEFFIKLLTKPGDTVLDPFAGSNVTGATAEALGRRWISIELDPEYVRASRFRFEAPPLLRPLGGGIDGAGIGSPAVLQ